MGNVTGIKIVSNSGPLIHLAQIGMIDLLDVFPVIVRAYHENLINTEQSEKAFNDLYNISSLFITRAIVDIAISEIRKYRNKK